ncbi:MAG TPA: hypothetical protein DCE56_18455 [Cyanobacteria bacterium UBA8553]|nr:hypothetical protein [Cyanobacteria bacterium UBA8553]HAJ63272.1 hypothetical protein [Cyanobacteria bacterium UBA8543]
MLFEPNSASNSMDWFLQNQETIVSRFCIFVPQTSQKSQYQVVESNLLHDILEIFMETFVKNIQYASLTNGI